MSEMNNNNPDWAKITEGKVRHGFAIEAFKKGLKLDRDTMDEVDRWVYFVIHGLDGIEKILKAGVLDTEKKITDNELKQVVVEKFDGEVLNGTEEEHVAGKISEAIKGLDKTNTRKVNKSLKDSKITLNNLDTCLTRIETMKSKQSA